MIQENEIRAQLLEYLSGNRNLDDVEDWIVQQSWNMHRDSNPDAQRLVGQIELALAEYNNNHISDVALRQRLDRIASTYIVKFAPAEAESISYTSNSSVQIPHFGMPIARVSVS